MWQRFTEQSRRVVFFAQEEAGKLGEHYVSTEHLLLGLLRTNDNVASRVLGRLGIGIDDLRQLLERQVKRSTASAGDMQLTPRAKAVIDLAGEEARLLGNKYIGTEHLLLGMIREGEGLAGRVLLSRDVTIERTRAVIVALQAEHQRDADLLKPVKRENVPSQMESLLESLPKPVRDVILDFYETVGAGKSNASKRSPAHGDRGVAKALDGIPYIEVATDAAAFVCLADIFTAKDAHGYRAMADGDQTMFLLPVGTPLKLLVPPPNSGDASKAGFYVRVLSGAHEGYAGWVFRTAFEWIGPDETAFPPNTGKSNL